MNETTLFLAQIIGPTLFFTGLGILLHPKFYEKVFKAMGETDFDTLLTPMIMIPIGIVMVLKHFLWNSLPEVLVSIVGLGILIKGILFAVMPTMFKSMIRSILTKGLITFASLLWIAGGAYLCWVGFWA